MLKIKNIITLLLLILLLSGCSASIDGHQESKQNEIDNCLKQNGKALIEYYNNGSGIRKVKCLIGENSVEKID